MVRIINILDLEASAVESIESTAYFWNGSTTDGDRVTVTIETKGKDYDAECN